MTDPCESRNWVVLPATQDDLPAIERLARCDHGGPSWPQEAWSVYLQPEQGTAVQRCLFQARLAEQELGGWLAGTRVADEAELEFVQVAFQQRRQGLGHRLVRAWMQWAACGGATHLHLEVRAQNTAAQALYRSLGFVIVGRRAGYYAHPADDALVMSYRA